MNWILNGVKRDDLERFESTLHRKQVNDMWGYMTTVTMGSANIGIAHLKHIQIPVSRIKGTNIFTSI